MVILSDEFDLAGLQLDQQEGAPPVTAPVIRVLDIPAALGRAYTADRRADGRRAAVDAGDAVWLRVTPGGHWRVVGTIPAEMACRGCAEEWLACQLDQFACPRPATAQGIAGALLGRTGVTA